MSPYRRQPTLDLDAVVRTYSAERISAILRGIGDGRRSPWWPGAEPQVPDEFTAEAAEYAKQHKRWPEMTPEQKATALSYKLRHRAWLREQRTAWQLRMQLVGKMMRREER